MTEPGKNGEQPVSLADKESDVAIQALWHTLNKRGNRARMREFAEQLGLKRFTINHLKTLQEVGQVSMAGGPVFMDLGVLNSGVHALFEQFKSLKQRMDGDSGFQDPSKYMEAVEIQTALLEEIRRYVETSAEIKKSHEAQKNSNQFSPKDFKPLSPIVPVQINVGNQGDTSVKEKTTNQ